MSTIKAANIKFNKWLEANTGKFAPPTGYGDHDYSVLDMPNKLDNHNDERIDFAKMFRDNK